MFSFIKCTLLIIGALLFTLESTQAICIYNNIVGDGQFSSGIFFQATSKLIFFKRHVVPGGVACCHWADKGCNNTGRKDGPVDFTVYFEAYVDNDIYCEEGGSIVFTGTSLDDITYTCTEPKGSQHSKLLGPISAL
ncbi:hypothetical protein BD770DRAFT_415934 [Pilaira anomala]|nr:hypothetical protein BD770DRAFT_415934 [Pilaira anomala]